MTENSTEYQYDMIWYHNIQKRNNDCKMSCLQTEYLYNVYVYVGITNISLCAKPIEYKSSPKAFNVHVGTPCMLAYIY